MNDKTADDVPELAVGHDPQRGRVTLQSCTTGERLYSFTPEDARIMASLLTKYARLCDPITGVREAFDANGYAKSRARRGTFPS